MCVCYFSVNVQIFGWQRKKLMFVDTMICKEHILNIHCAIWGTLRRRKIFSHVVWICTYWFGQKILWVLKYLPFCSIQYLHHVEEDVACM